MTGSVEVLLGPPGTGKTTALLQRVEDELKRGTPPERIAFSSFTRAAREEVLARVGTKFSLGPDDFPWLKTIHGTAYRLLGQPGGVLDGAAWREFGAAHGYRFSITGRLNVEDGLAALPRQTPDDALRAMYEWGRSRSLDIEQTLSAAPALVFAESFRRFVRRYVEFKRDKRLLDFNDMIENALAGPTVPPVDVAFIDEAQDLSPLQIKAVQQWFSGCRAVHVAGDDDQAIYGFQGADPGWLLELAKTHPTKVLEQSYRVPARVHELAQKIVARNVRRIAKAYSPRPEAGDVQFLPLEAALKQMDGASNALVLVRNRCFMERVAAELRNRGVPYEVEGGGATNPLNPKILGAARAAHAVVAEAAVAAEDFQAMLELIPSNGLDLLPRGVKAAAAPLRGTISADAISRLLRGGRVRELATANGALSVLTNLEPETRRYLERVQTRHGSFVIPKVRLTTIHGSKGREAELVILVPDMTRATHFESLDQRRGGAEAENRVAYVGATRARERLIIAAPQTRLAYAYPRVGTVSTSSTQAQAA